MKLKCLLVGCIAVLIACSSKESSIPVVGFIEAFEDATISRAREGFVAALADAGFTEKDQTVKIIYRNAQGDIPTLTQIVNFFISEKVNLIASCTTLSTIAAIQKTKDIPVFMMVSPTPARMKVTDREGRAPANLHGVSEELAYIDTSFSFIPRLIKPKGDNIIVGMVYNQSEPQSVDAFNRINLLAGKLNIKIEALPLNSSADAQLVMQSLASRNLDVFFANPDNAVFASFETILKICNKKNIPIFTSESGLVKRGAVVAFGADIFAWGYQSGMQAAKFLKGSRAAELKVELVKKRVKVYNPEVAKRYQITVPPDFEMLH